MQFYAKQHLLAMILNSDKWLGGEDLKDSLTKMYIISLRIRPIGTHLCDVLLGIEISVIVYSYNSPV